MMGIVIPIDLFPNLNSRPIYDILVRQIMPQLNNKDVMINCDNDALMIPGHDTNQMIFLGWRDQSHLLTK